MEKRWQKYISVIGLFLGIGKSYCGHLCYFGSFAVIGNSDVGVMHSLINWIRGKLRFQDNYLPMGLDTMSMEALLSLYYSVWRVANIRINSMIPNCKNSREFSFSFYNFIVTRIERVRPVTVLDIGSNNCYLPYLLSKEMHGESMFDCVDKSKAEPLYLAANIKFYQEDVFSFIKKWKIPSYDYVILGAVLALFEREQRSILFEFLRQCKFLFIREVPKITNLIDAYCEKDLLKYKGWSNYSESHLKEELQAHGFEILTVEHEYDIYVYAQPRGISSLLGRTSRKMLSR